MASKVIRGRRSYQIDKIKGVPVMYLYCGWYTIKVLVWYFTSKKVKVCSLLGPGLNSVIGCFGEIFYCVYCVLVFVQCLTLYVCVIIPGLS